MNEFHQKMGEIVEKLNYIESRRIRVGKFIRKINDIFEIGPNDDISDVQIINKCPAELKDKVSVVGVDGGIVKHSFHGLDLMLLRATGVNFVYENGNLDGVFYYPSSNPFPKPKIVVETLSDIEFNLCSNIERQIIEVNTTIKSMEKMKPDIVLMDGSVIPQYVFNPDNQEVKGKYKKLIGAYSELYKKAKKTKTVLAGVVEDSRSSKFSEMLNKKLLNEMRTELSKEMASILEKTKDSNLLFYTLEKGERTCVFNYCCSGNTQPIIKEFKGMEKDFFSFYIKTVDFDRPLRIDFLGNGNELKIVDEIAPVLLNTSGHSGYGLPAVLIEADQRAKLSEKDLDMFYFDLINKVGNISSLFKMRREMRPF